MHTKHTQDTHSHTHNTQVIRVKPEDEESPVALFTNYTQVPQIEKI